MKVSNNGSAKRERRHFTGQQKVSIVKQHLVDGIAVADPVLSVAETALRERRYGLRA